MNSGIRFFLATMAVIILLIFGIVIIIRSGSGDGQLDLGSSINLSDLTEDTSANVSYTVEGPINASEDHRLISITISPTSRQIDVIRGYEGEIMNRQTYDNNTSAYGEFLEALNRAGFTRERRLREGINSEAICPLGNRSYFKITEDSSDVLSLWTASCIDGSYNGDVSLTTRLFRTQIPDYGTITKGVDVTGSTVRNTGLVL